MPDNRHPTSMPRIWPGEEILQANEERARMRMESNALRQIDEALDRIYGPGVDQLAEALGKVESDEVRMELMEALQKTLAAKAWELLILKLRNPG